MQVIDTNLRSTETNTEPVKPGCDVSSQMDFSVNTENKENQTEQRPNKRHEEYQYLEKVAEIMKCGNTRIDRTNVGTKSIFGAQARYSLRNSELNYWVCRYFGFVFDCFCSFFTLDLKTRYHCSQPRRCLFEESLKSSSGSLKDQPMPRSCKLRM